MNDFSPSVRDLREKLLAQDGIPTLPTIVQDIMEVTANPRSGVKDVEKVVEKDQSCSIKLLKLSNSAYYGFSRQITTIKQAIVIIGLEGVKNAAVSLGMAGCFAKGAKGNSDVFPRLWVHSMATATAAQILAKNSKGVSESFAYLSVLIHDFGKVVLLGHFREKYSKVFNQAKEEKVPISLVEQSELGIDHETVASWISEAWDLPATIKEVAKNHHSGYHLDQTDKSILLVGLADAVAYASGVGDGGNGRPPKVDDSYLQTLGLTQDTANLAIAELKKQKDRFFATLKMAD
jgi:HD-like signal output (HDOD) protein